MMYLMYCHFDNFSLIFAEIVANIKKNLKELLKFSNFIQNLTNQ